MPNYNVFFITDKQRIRTDASTVLDQGPASLGMPCFTDSQCQSVDQHTRCYNKRCDCAYRTNSTSACSARNRGCLPGTFQVTLNHIFTLITICERYVDIYVRFLSNKNGQFFPNHSKNILTF